MATTASLTPVRGDTAGDSDTNAVAGMLVLAQQSHDKYIGDGKAEADRILAETNTESQRTIAEAEKQCNRMLTQLRQGRGFLERKISELRDLGWDYRTRLKNYLESLLADAGSGPTPSSDQC